MESVQQTEPIKPYFSSNWLQLGYYIFSQLEIWFQNIWVPTLVNISKGSLNNLEKKKVPNRHAFLELEEQELWHWLFEPQSGRTKDYKIGICCFSA